MDTLAEKFHKIERKERRGHETISLTELNAEVLSEMFLPGWELETNGDQISFERKIDNDVWVLAIDKTERTIALSSQKFDAHNVRFADVENVTLDYGPPERWLVVTFPLEHRSFSFSNPESSYTVSDGGLRHTRVDKKGREIFSFRLGKPKIKLPPKSPLKKL